MSENKVKNVRVHLAESQLFDIGKARKSGESPRVIAKRMNLKVMTVRNVISSLVKQGVKFPKLERASVSKYVEIAKKLV